MKNKWERIMRKKRSYYPSIIIVTVFAVVLVFLTWLAKLPIAISGFYFIASLISYIVYAVDKLASQKETRRIPENTLHFLSLVGGWPGALIAQQKLRHKSQKKSFRTIFWMTVFINIFTFVWFFGNAILQSLFI